MKIVTVTIECCEEMAKDGPAKMQMNSEAWLHWRCVYCGMTLVAGKEELFNDTCSNE